MSLLYATGHRELRTSQETIIKDIHITASLESIPPKELQVNSLNTLLGIEDLVRMITEFV